MSKCIHYTGGDSVIQSSDKDSFCAECFQDLFEKRANISNVPAYIKSKPPPVPPKPGKAKLPPAQEHKPEQIVNPKVPGFVCASCDCNLEGKTVEAKAGKVYCSDCYEKVIQKICCHQCADLIRPDIPQVTYQGNPYHQRCFACSKCHLPIGEKKFCTVERGIFCEQCYFETSGKHCIKCKNVLSSTGFMFRDQPWHKSCFTCTACHEMLDNTKKEIFCKGEAPYCNNCYDSLFLDKCAGCGEALRGELVEYQEKSFHESCFVCNECSMPIGANSFFPREGKVFCQTCFIIHFGKMCTKCGLSISPESGNGVVYLEQHYHRDCLTCMHCQKSLVGQPIHSSKDQNDPYCIDCYNLLFGKKCAVCEKIISSVIGSKFIAYEEKYYHSDCFNCKICGSSLANRKFCPRDNDILCGPCAKYVR